MLPSLCPLPADCKRQEEISKLHFSSELTLTGNVHPDKSHNILLLLLAQVSQKSHVARLQHQKLESSDKFYFRTLNFRFRFSALTKIEFEKENIFNLFLFFPIFSFPVLEVMQNKNDRSVHGSSVCRNKGYLSHGDLPETGWRWRNTPAVWSASNPPCQVSRKHTNPFV